MMAKADEKAKNTPGRPGATVSSTTFANTGRSGGITVVDDTIDRQRTRSGCCGGGGGGGPSVVEGLPDPGAVQSQ